MDSVKSLDLYVCGEASGQENIKEHRFGACRPVICVKPDETSTDITVGVRMAVMWLAKYTQHGDKGAHWYGPI